MNPFSIVKTNLSNLLGWWIEIAKQRRALRELTDCQLNDIGISYKEAMHEAGRAFWDHSSSLRQSNSTPKASSALSSRGK